MEKTSTRPNTINLIVSRLEDILNKIIPIFKENSLITKKYLDFYYFSKLGYLMKNKQHLTEKGYDEILFIKTLKKKGKILVIVCCIKYDRKQGKLHETFIPVRCKTICSQV
jgi:hypothetical protein